MLKILFFLGLNFVTISLDSSYVKNQFLGPSRVYRTPLGPLFLLFPTFFFSRFLHFFIFYHLLFISSFFDFLNVFHFLFSFFSEEKGFFFFLYFFQICVIAGIGIRV